MRKSINGGEKLNACAYGFGVAMLGCLLPPYNTLVDRYACMLTTEVLSLDAGFCFESASNDVAWV